MEMRATPEGLVALGKRSILTAQGFAIAITIATIAVMWRRPRVVAFMIGVFIVESTANWLLSVQVKHRLGHIRSEALRTVINTVLHCMIGVVCGWSLVSWLYVPFGASLVAVPVVHHGHRRVFAMLAVIVTCALLTGGTADDALVFAGISLFLHFMLLAYLDLANNLIRDRDRTYLELVSARQAAIAHEKLAGIGQLAAGVAHEINNPMTFVTANVDELLETLRDDPELPARYHEFRDSVVVDTVDGIRRVNSIVADLRRFARGEPLAESDFDLAEEVTAAVRMARTQLGSQQTLTTTIQPRLRMRGRGRELGQVALNLLVNAIQSIDASGHVHVEAKREGERLTLSVADDGHGMPPEVVARLFEPFFTTRAPGLGLGLAAVHGIVAAHAGSIDVVTNPGQGSNFQISLPALERAAP
jgi:two-component system, NtrC family, sensor kinase